MSDGHLVAYGCKTVVRGLFDFSVTKPRVVLLDYLPVFVGFLKLFAISGYLRTRIVSDIKILCAAITFAGIE